MGEEPNLPTSAIDGLAALGPEFWRPVVSFEPDIDQLLRF